MIELLHDIRHALRTFRTQRGFTVAVVITLALGIGMSTAMFSVLNAVLLRPLPQANADRVVRLYQPNGDARTTGLSPLEIADYRRGAAGVLDDLVEYHSMPFTFIGEHQAQRLQTGVVSAGFFEALGIRPLLGRTFQAGEDQPGAAPVLVLSYAYWQRELGGDPAAVGSTLRMNDRTHTVVGVLPPFPQYPDENDIYMPVSSCPFRSAPGWAENRSARGLAAFGLLRSGIAAEAALPELRALSGRLQAEYPEAYQPGVVYEFAAVPLAELIARPARTTLVVLLLATMLLLAGVCSNVANLTIVRVLRRDGEMAVRLAFGATRAHLVRQLLTESAVLAAAGGAIGLLLAYASTGLLAAFVARFSPRAPEVSVDAAVLLFAIGATAATAVIAGLLPLAALRRGIASTLRNDGARSGAGTVHARVRNGLIVLQVAVSLVLLIGAGLLGRTLVHLQTADTGLTVDGVMTARLDLNWTRYATSAQQYAFYRELEEELLRMPGVSAAGIGSSFPLNGDPAQQVNVVASRADGASEELSESLRVAALTATGGYFATLGVPLLRGRSFTRADEQDGGELVAVITRSLAEKHWPGVDPTGQRISLDGGASWGIVVGMTGDIRLGLEGDFDDVLFVPHNRFGGMQSRVLVRSALPAAAVDQLIRAAVAALDGQQPIADIMPLDAHRGQLLSPYRLTALLMSLFALISLTVTALGLGAAIAFSVAQRTREIGIRVAIGARPSAVIRMAVGNMMLLVLVGAVIGVAVAVYAGRFLVDVTAGVSATDPATYVGVMVVVAAVTMAAGLIPAVRAVRIDPVRALRER